jgi:hypothetical protein
MSESSFLDSPRSRFGAAMALAVAADALQIFVLPWFAEGALSPVDDILDLVVMVALISLIGWNWEFLPSFLGELVPGLDLVPFWTLAVISVYRKHKPAKTPAPAEPGVRTIDVEATVPAERDPRRGDFDSPNRHLPSL